MIKSNATKKVIIVDDDVNILVSLKFLFKSENFNLETISNSEEALIKILDIDYDLIISDIEMPKLSGIDMIKKVEKIKKVNKLIFMSSNINYYIDDIMKLNAVGVNKPFRDIRIILDICRSQR